MCPVKTSMRALLLTCVALLIAGCNAGTLPTKAEVIAEFTGEHPTATIVSAVVGERDFQHACWHIRYSEPGRAVVQELEWGARSVGETGWEVFYRGDQAREHPGTGPPRGL
jgi:hypothetical protein